MSTRFPHLLSPMRIGNMEVRNRLVTSAYQTNLGQDYRPTRRMAEYHAARARGGAGLVVLEGARLHPTTRSSQANLIGWDEEAIPEFRMVADAVHQHGAKIVGQILHLGRTASSADTLLPLWLASIVPAPPVFGLNTSELTHAMTRQDIQEVVEWSARCAVNLQRAGMDGVEFHAGHGYLPQQFLSPLSNFRADEYGGDLKSRARFTLETLAAVRRALGADTVLGVRISADELVPGGLTIDHTTQAARWLEETGDVDYISVSLSTNEPMSHAQQIPDMSWPQAPFVHLAEAIKKATDGIPIFTVGRITDPYVAEEIVAQGRADMVCIARGHIADPEIGRKLMEDRPGDIRQCIGCNQGCAGRINAGLSVGCLVNPEAGRELELGSVGQAPRSKSVVVVGGGPAGLEAARVAAMRGHSVVLHERQSHLGGQIATLVKAPHRQEFARVVEWLEGQLTQLGVEIRLGSEVSPEQLEGDGVEAVIITTGSVPSLPDIPGLGRDGGPPLASAGDALEERVSGKRVVLLDGDGHHKALSTGEFLAEHGSEVHLVTRAPMIGVEITTVSQTPAVKRLVDNGVRFHRSCWIETAEDGNVVLRRTDTGEERVVEAVDLVVAAVPNRPSTDLYEAVAGRAGIPEVVAVGDCVAPRRAMEAIREGHMAARGI